MMDDPLAVAVTEQENPRSRDIASMSIADAVALINDEDARVAEAVRRTLPDVVRAIEGIVARLEKGGRLIHVGTGTSGRLGVLDASECPPTFGVTPELVQGLIAGGYDACHQAVEASEDDREAGGRDLDSRGVSALDAVVGIAASGRTPYTIGAVERARALGAFTVAVTCAPGSEITRAVDVAIVPVVGPEVLAGSSRMKAGTAQKMVLNMLSTVTMIRLGYVTGNRMTNMRARNSKLHARSIRIIRAETGVDDAAAQAALERTAGDLPSAIVMLKTGRTPDEAKAALASAKGIIAKAVAALSQGARIRRQEARDASDSPLPPCSRPSPRRLPAAPAVQAPGNGAAASAAHHRLRRASRRRRAEGERRGRAVGRRRAQGEVRRDDQRRRRPLRERRRPAGAAAHRRKSQECAKILGIETEVLDIHDGELMPTLENRRTVARLIRDWQADIVMGHRPYDYHPDHRYTGVLMDDAAVVVVAPFFVPDTTPTPRNPVFMYYSDGFQDPEAVHAERWWSASTPSRRRSGSASRAMPSQFGDKDSWQGRTLPERAAGRRASGAAYLLDIVQEAQRRRWPTSIATGWWRSTARSAAGRSSTPRRFSSGSTAGRRRRTN